ncbi:MAG: hypothetical protein RLO12_04375, partial [Fulvivirga sp.]
MLKTTLKYLPFLSGFLVFLGVLKLTMYYGYFGIEIISYLSISDILIAFLSDLNTIVISVFLVIHLQFADGVVNDWLGEEYFDFIILKFRKFYQLFFTISLIVVVNLIVFRILPINLISIY